MPSAGSSSTNRWKNRGQSLTDARARVSLPEINFPLAAVGNWVSQNPWHFKQSSITFRLFYTDRAQTRILIIPYLQEY